VQYRILGPLEVADDSGRVLQIGGRKQRALLAVLLLRANEIVSTDTLIDELWGSSPPGTAANTVQVHISHLRKALAPGDAIATRPPGYVLRVERGQLDLDTFLELADEGRAALAQGRAAEASERLRAALAVWRGPALGDLVFEPFSQSAVLRLDELRLAVLEDRIEADLAHGRHAEVIPEIDALIREHPLRERQRGQLMLALYRSGRQAEALEMYQAARRALVEELGIEPSPALQRLEKAILTQDASLDLPAAEPRGPARPTTAEDGRSILVVPRAERSVGGLTRLAAGLARSGASHELILVRLVAGAASSELSAATALLAGVGKELEAEGVKARTAAFTSQSAGRDIVRLAGQQDVDLLLVDVAVDSLSDGLDDELTTVLAEAPCDVAALVERAAADVPGPEQPVVVPFSGAEHDWAALELGAWIAGSFGSRLLLAGPQSGDASERDASWLLANASLVVQQFAGVPSEPVLVPPGAEGLLSAAEGAGLVLVGLTDRWRSIGVGPSRSALAERSAAPVALVRRGLRPSGLAPRGTLTRFTWSLGGRGLAPASGG
jgi:DNA-binding SARP family transcriptional activator